MQITNKLRKIYSFMPDWVKNTALLQRIKVYVKNKVGLIPVEAILPTNAIALSELSVFNRVKSVAHQANNKNFDLVLPVYNAFDLLVPLLDSIIKNTDLNYTLWIIDDCSPDERVFPYLQEFASKHPQVILARNAKNLGFVKTVNKMLRQTKNDVVIINSDTLLPENWLSLLLQPLAYYDNVASITPLSNAATIASFPILFIDNDLPAGMSLQQINNVFNRLQPSKDIFFSTPTGVGFCMFMSRKCLTTIGFFDEEAFGKGYGEENDWCCRAEQQGFVNLINPTLFVYHQHGGSFASEEKKKLQRENIQIIFDRYPNYLHKVREAGSNPEYLKIRQLLSVLTFYAAAKRTVVVFDHYLGGGAYFWLEQQWIVNKDIFYLIIRPTIDKESDKNFLLKVHFSDKILATFYFDKMSELSFIKQYFKIDEILINELFLYPDLDNLIQHIIHFADKKIPIKFVVHDFFSVCPSVNLIDVQGKWCDIPLVQQCSACFPDCSSVIDYKKKYKTIQQWRQSFFRLFTYVDKFYCLSYFSRKMILKAYPEIEQEKIQVIKPSINYVNKVYSASDLKKEINIGIIGNITYNKGAKIIYEMAEMLENYPDKYSNVKLRVIGEIEYRYVHPNLTVIGPYPREKLSAIVQENKIDIIFIPSICGETYSYTTQEAILMELPLAVFNFGAQAERTKQYAKGLVLTDVSANCLDLIIQHAQKYKILC